MYCEKNQSNNDRCFAQERKQSLLINAFKSDLVPIGFGVLEGSALPSFLFFVLIYFSVLDVAKAHRFADDVNMFHINKSMNDLSKDFKKSLMVECLCKITKNVQ